MSERHRNPFLIDDEPQQGENRRITLIITLAIVFLAVGSAVFFLTMKGESMSPDHSITTPQEVQTSQPE